MTTLEYKIETNCNNGYMVRLLVPIDVWPGTQLEMLQKASDILVNHIARMRKTSLLRDDTMFELGSVEDVFEEYFDDKGKGVDPDWSLCKQVKE